MTRCSILLHCRVSLSQIGYGRRKCSLLGEAQQCTTVFTRRLGATVVNLPPRDIVSAMKSGALDAAEWVGPSADFELGLHTAARYYYYPGFHEPGTATAVGVNLRLWASLQDSERHLIETAVKAFFTVERADIHFMRAKVLTMLSQEHGVQLRAFDDETLRAFGRVSGEVVAELGATDFFTKRVYDSCMAFLRSSRTYTGISDRAYLNARELGFPYGV